MKKIFKPFCDFYYFAKDKIDRSIRLELVLTFFVCLLAAFIVGTWYNGRYNEKHVISQIDYSKSINKITNYLSSAKKELENINFNENKINSSKINSILDDILKNDSNKTIKLFLCDLNGNVLYKSSNVDEQKIDIHSLIIKSRDFKIKCENSAVLNVENGIIKRRIVLDDNTECIDIDGINFSNEKAYLIVRGIPTRSLSFIRPNGTPVSVLAGIATFIAFFYFLTSKKMRYIEKLSEGLGEISKNNLDYKIEIQGKDELANLASNINFMASELKNRIQKEREAEKTKNDLITNVSHDLRTPLTSIKGYLALVKDKNYKNEEELSYYVNISYNKSEKLELLINDLFEYTKLSNRGITLNKSRICLSELLEQLVEELYVICEQNNVKIKFVQFDKNVYATVDGDKMARVFENLLMNAIRYSTKPGEILLRMTCDYGSEDYGHDVNNSNYDRNIREHGNDSTCDNYDSRDVLGKCNDSDDGHIIVSIENNCPHISDDKLEKMFNRFYRIDESRSQATGGSGLGLAIAKSIVELHGGQIWAKSPGDNIIFFVKI